MIIELSLRFIYFTVTRCSYFDQDSICNTGTLCAVSKSDYICRIALTCTLAGTGPKSATTPGAKHCTIIMRIITLLVLFIISSCSSVKKATHNGNVNKLIYTVENSQEVVPIISKMGESLVDSTKAYILSDSAKMKIYQNFNKQTKEAAKWPNEIEIEITKDGWTKQRFINNKHSYCFKHFIENDSVIVYDSNRVDFITSYKKTADNCFCKLSIDKSKTKSILGYKCYYAKAEEICSKTYSKDTLSTTYEMYVTDKIHLPLHAILENECKHPGYFPLEVNCFLSNEFYYQYKLTRIQ